jgi:hypothetical protein
MRFGLGSQRSPFIEDALHLAIELFALCQHLIKVVLAEVWSGQITGRHLELLHLDDGLLRIDDPEVNDGLTLTETSS